MDIGYRLGVDFGTSNTVAVLRWPDGRARPLLFDGSPLLPSGVFAARDGELLTGRDAAHSAQADPDRFEPNPKRCVDDGTMFLGDRALPVGEAIGAVLGRVRREAERTAGRPVDAVTLTHPVAWGGPRLAVLAKAADRAGLVAPSLVPEPVAAATWFATAHDVPVGGCLIIYDLGGGTFDVSVVRRDAAGFTVLAADGLADAGGLDVDAAVLDWLGSVYGGREPAAWQRLEWPSDPAERRARRLLWDDVRTAKEMLSRTASTAIHVPLLDTDALLGREKLEELARPVLDRTAKLTVDTVRASRVSPRATTGVYLVGGSSRMPLAATLLHRALRLPPTVIEQPELVVAEGCLTATPASPPGTPPPVPAPAPVPASPHRTPPGPAAWPASAPSAVPPPPRSATPSAGPARPGPAYAADRARTQPTGYAGPPSARPDAPALGIPPPSAGPAAPGTPAARVRGTAPRDTAPHGTAPRATAGGTTPRTTAPRSTAPRSTAPRTTAPQGTASAGATAPGAATRGAAAPGAASRGAASPGSARTRALRVRRAGPDLLWSDDELRKKGTAGPHSYGMIALLLGIPAAIALAVIVVLAAT
ncbi:MAG TPA: Hsp70 family protein [Actinocatenispora sp.]